MRFTAAPRTLSGAESDRITSLTCGTAQSHRGKGRGRTAGLPLFRRTLVPAELPYQYSLRTCYPAISLLPSGPGEVRWLHTAQEEKCGALDH